MQACLLYNMEIYHIKEHEGTLFFRVPFFHAERAEVLLRKQGLVFRRDALGGAAGMGIKLIKHPGTLIGMVLAVILYLWLSGMVWEVRIVSRTDIDEDRVLRLLAECGLEEGSRISRLDEDEVIADYLMLDDTVAFAAVHLNGVVAEVELIPYEGKAKPENKGEPCNIIATEDALITDMIVYSGRALVKVGQTVHAGDILVSGIVTDAEGTRLVKASADIRGQRSCEIQVSSPVEISETQIRDRQIDGVGLCVFGKTLSIGILEGDGIALEKKRLYLFDRIRLPIEWVTAYTYETELVTRALTEEEQQYRAEGMLEEQLERLLDDGALLGLEKKSVVSEAGVTITAQIVFENNIGKSLAFGEKKQ